MNEKLLDGALRHIAVAASSDPKGEWAEKYGTIKDNEVFMMHPFCWCERDDCAWCGGEILPQLMRECGFEKEKESAPNFWYKPLDFKVWWYKYIGRSVEINKSLSNQEITEMLTTCLATLPSKQ